jgi:hypothetical protein
MLHGNPPLLYDTADAHSSTAADSRVVLMTAFRTANGMPLKIDRMPCGPFRTYPCGCNLQNASTASCQAATARSTESVDVVIYESRKVGGVALAQAGSQLALAKLDAFRICTSLVRPAFAANASLHVHKQPGLPINSGLSLVMRSSVFAAYPKCDLTRRGNRSVSLVVIVPGLPVQLVHFTSFNDTIRPWPFEE